ncbi:MAG: glutamate synthase-related protein [Clostridiaceae bacterium]
MGKLPVWDENHFEKRISELRAKGAKRICFKTGPFDPEDLLRILKIASKCEVDLVTFDGAGGGTGNSPVKMMNEWGLPTVLLEETVLQITRDMKNNGLYVPAITITGGFSSEDQVFKALAYGMGHVTSVGIGRAAMAAAMTGKHIGQRIEAGEVPKAYQKYGSSVAQIYGDLPELRALYGKAADDFSPGAIGVFSYLNKLAFGLKHFAALNRKFDMKYLDQTDLIPLTRDAKDLIKGRWFD